MEYEVTEQTIHVKALVKSETHAGAYYKVLLDGDSYTCTCPDNTTRETLCKHIRAVKEGLGAYG